ncbi:hypothetical protein [Thermogemmatispora tikiterensis]|uniref:Uncharacterized protein n=1 Tax=Thermogemmatispora tikiterensis TaxID=1825093 RepID=A0A328V9I6_9CHLR|nr:hypothetical protein [Thermogemmatispora tikiterensis]RAQ94316.1 hypothetical protein A4R35_02150 [Thermogemmatispora tikiterensis]
MFLTEAGRLLDQQAESMVKRAVERYCAGELSYEAYQEIIEQVSKQEAQQGAALGEMAARNRVFDLAQRLLDQAQEHARQLQLIEAKTQLEQERRKTEDLLSGLLQQYTDELQQCAQQIKNDLASTTEALIEQTRQLADQVVLQRFQEAREQLERAIREQEEQRPAREAMRTASERLMRQEREYRRHQWRIWCSIGLGLGVALVLLISLFFAPPLWIVASGATIAVALLASAALWRNPIPEERLAAARREIALYQARSGDYATLSEEERRALLLQRIV